MFTDWLIQNWREMAAVPLSLVLLYAIAIISHRLFGLRSYSKMSGTDFVSTVALGSLIGASIAAPSPSVVIAGTGVFGLLALMWAAAFLKRRSPRVRRLMENDAIYLMRDGEVLAHNLDRAQVTLDELHGKLRENGVWSYTQVVAVVFERTGDMSVLRHEGTDAAPDPAIFSDVQGASPPGQNTRLV